MKLIGREPTQEMIAAMQMDKFHLASYVKALFQAAYDAAPVVEQKPVAWLCTMPNIDRTVPNRPEPRLCPVDGWKNEPLFAFPPDAQAEIAARIKELEKKAELPMKYRRMQFNAELQEEVKKQAAEISRLTEASRTKHLEAIDWAGKHQEATEQITRLKSVLTKCKTAIIYLYGCYPPPYKKDEKAEVAKTALAAIKEIEK